MAGGDPPGINSEIAPGHASAADCGAGSATGSAKGSSRECRRRADLGRGITLLIEKMGGATLIGEARDNLCRRATAQEKKVFGQGSGQFGQDVEWIVESQGLPNLVHELIHALFLGRLADDHGFDYGQIPLDLGRREHRRYLWEELACCALSTVICAQFESDPETFAREWFAEQFEIQGVFHGLEHDLIAFRARIGAQLAQPEGREELTNTVERGRRLVHEGLAGVGVVADLPACDAIQLWRRYLAV